MHTESCFEPLIAMLQLPVGVPRTLSILRDVVPLRGGRSYDHLWFPVPTCMRTFVTIMWQCILWSEGAPAPWLTDDRIFSTTCTRHRTLGDQNDNLSHHQWSLSAPQVYKGLHCRPAASHYLMRRKCVCAASVKRGELSVQRKQPDAMERDRSWRHGVKQPMA